MGNDSQPQAAPPPPAAPNYAAANREAVQADIDTLGTRRRIEQASKLGRSVYDPDTGKTYDFTGLGDSELARQQADVNAQTADENAASALAVGQKYGPAFNQLALDSIKQSDPAGFEGRQFEAQQVLDDAKLGSQISPEAEKEAERQIRGAQAARGNILGNAATSQEILGKFELGEKLKQQRLGNLSQYVLGTPITAQYQNLQGAQQGAAPYQPVAYQPGVGLNANAGQQGAAFASSIYGTQMQGYGSGLGYSANVYGTDASKPNPWMQGLGIAASAVGTVAAAY